jgi:hypothetical protein
VHVHQAGLTKVNCTTSMLASSNAASQYAK